MVKLENIPTPGSVAKKNGGHKSSSKTPYVTFAVLVALNLVVWYFAIHLWVTRIAAKDGYTKYKLYKKDPATYRRYAIYADDYKAYKNYDKYVNGYKKYSSYSKYKKYDKKEYSAGKNYCGADYKAGSDRWQAAEAKAAATIGEADLGCGIKDSSNNCLGPDISVGLVEYSKSDLTGSSFNIHAYSASTGNLLDYVIKDGSGAIKATILATAPITQTKVKYLSNKNFRIYDSVTPEIQVSSDIIFEAADPTKTNDIVFSFNRPSSDYDDFRGKISLHYFNNSSGSDSIWAINTLPIEEYVWGMGEITGTGPTDHNKVMTTVFRTYGYWKDKFSTKYAAQGFKVNATPGNQLYYGYEWEKNHTSIKTAAQATRSQLIMYLKGGTNEIALTPYSSWTDGKTRSFEEVWGSTDYPWCQSVSDPYGKNSSMTTKQLQDAGNHMVGLSAHGSLALAGDSYKWTWQQILQYYFHAINIRSAY